MSLLLNCSSRDRNREKGLLLANISIVSPLFQSHNSLAVKRPVIECIGVSIPLKNTTSLFLAKAFLNLQTVQAPFFRQSPLYRFFVNSPTPSPPKRKQIFQ